MDLVPVTLWQIVEQFIHCLTSARVQTSRKLMTFHFINTPKEIFQPLTALENTLIPPNLTHPPADLSHCSNGMFLFRRNLGSTGISLKPSITGDGVPHLQYFHKRGSHHSSSQQRFVQEVLKVTKSRQQIKGSSILPKNEQNALRILP